MIRLADAGSACSACTVVVLSDSRHNLHKKRTVGILVLVAPVAATPAYDLDWARQYRHVRCRGSAVGGRVDQAG
jgi:hypothetical protein